MSGGHVAAHCKTVGMRCNGGRRDPGGSRVSEP